MRVAKLLFKAAFRELPDFLEGFKSATVTGTKVIASDQPPLRIA